MLEQAGRGPVSQRLDLGLCRNALQGIEQQWGRCSAFQVHPAQVVGVDAAEAAGLRKLFWRERGICLAKTACQLREWPLAGLFMLAAPGTLGIVRQRGLPGIGRVGVNDPPLLQVVIEALFEELTIHADEMPALVQVLAKRIGLQGFG